MVIDRVKVDPLLWGCVTDLCSLKAVVSIMQQRHPALAYLFVTPEQWAQLAVRLDKTVWDDYHWSIWYGYSKLEPDFNGVSVVVGNGNYAAQG